jgi:3-oxoacyl-[acyl-carrier protein] reductase
MNLKGKVAVVTGASRGIGRAIALRLARDGALVCVNYHSNAEAAQTVVGEIKSSGGDAFALQADVGSVERLGRFYEALDAELTARRGDRQFDILVNNAGVAVVGTTATATEADFDRVFSTNVTSLGRIGKVEDIADAVAMLASPDSGWVTGQYVEASGGLGLVMPGFESH